MFLRNTITNLSLKLLLQIIEEDIENYASVIKGLHDQVDELGDEDKTSPEVVDRCRKYVMENMCTCHIDHFSILIIIHLILKYLLFEILMPDNFFL